MTELWVAAAAVTAVVIVLLAWPLLRRSDATARDRSAHDLAVWRDKLAEVDRDLRRRLIDPEQAEAARLEIKHRILALADEASASAQSTRPSPLLATAVAVIIPVAGVAGYLVLGTPEGRDQPLAARDIGADRNPVATADGSRGAGSDGPSLETAIEQLRQHLAESPDDARGWQLLGRSLQTLERHGEAAVAFGRAWALDEQDSERAALYAEARVAAADGVVDAEAVDAFAHALAIDRANPKARYYLALAKAQQGDVQKALQGWVDLVAISPPNAPWLKIVRRQIARAAEDLGVEPSSVTPSDRVPTLTTAPPVAVEPMTVVPDGSAILSKEQIEAAETMSEADRAALVRGMVERLAVRLKDDPNDRDGWLRLAHAWDVLGEPKKAEAARARAQALQ